MSTIIIKSGKIISRMFLQYSFEEKKETSNDTHNIKSDLPIHQDCEAALNNLIPHFILMCEQHKENAIIKGAISDGVDLSQLKEDHLLNQYKVTQFNISGTADAEGVVISGKRYLNSGKTINFSTPFYRWDDDYKYMDELIEAVEALREEVYQYSRGKHAPLPKSKDEFDVDVNEEEEVSSAA